MPIECTIPFSIKSTKQKKNNILISSGNNSTIYYHNAPVNWIRAHSFAPFFKSERDGLKISTQLKPINFADNEEASCASAIMCSSTFFLFWLSNSDCYHLNKPELQNFNIDLQNSLFEKKLFKKAKKLEHDLKKKAKRRIYFYKTSGKVEYDEFYLKKSKLLIDKIDTILAKHYDFTQEELDFIINYDIKYRMGKELNG